MLVWINSIASNDMIIFGVIAGMLGLLLVMLVLLIVTMSKLRRLSRSYQSFMRGKDAETLEEVILSRFQELDSLRQASEENHRKIEEITQNLLVTYQKIGIEKYNAFQEMGGKLSFALALLDKSNNGFVLNSMHSRESCYTYVKEIIDGKSYIALGEEEKKAVEKAVHFDGLE